MDYTDEQLRVVFKRGRCYHCMRELSFSHFGRKESPGGWYIEKVIDHMSGEVDLRHSRASCYPCSKDRRGKTNEHDRRIGSSHAAWFPH